MRRFSALTVAAFVLALAGCQGGAPVATDPYQVLYDAHGTWDTVQINIGATVQGGTTPFTLDRYHARLTVNLVKKTGVAAEWAKDKYDDTSLPVANFDADRYGLYLRWTP